MMFNVLYFDFCLVGKFSIFVQELFNGRYLVRKPVAGTKFLTHNLLNTIVMFLAYLVCFCYNHTLIINILSSCFSNLTYWYLFLQYRIEFDLS